MSTFWLLAWQTIRVGKARRLAKIEYPQGETLQFQETLPHADRSLAVYAEKAEAAANEAALKFNCAQRKLDDSQHVDFDGDTPFGQVHTRTLLRPFL